MEDKKLNVFISQPMADKSYEEIIKTRKKVAEKVRKYFETNELNFMNSCFITKDKEIYGVKNEPLYWLSKSIEVLANSDVIVMSTGWEQSRGCKIEYECARMYDILVIYEDTDYIVRDKLFEVDSDTDSIH